MIYYLYHYDYDFLDRGVITEATLSPVSPYRPLVPARSTLIEPIKSGAEYVILRFSEEAQAWEEIPDYRGYVYWTSLLGKVEMLDFGVLLPPRSDKWTAARPIILDEETNLWRYRTEVDDQADLDRALEIQKEEAIKTSRKASYEVVASFFEAEYGSEELLYEKSFYFIRYLEIKELENDENHLINAKEDSELKKIKEVKDDIRAIMKTHNDFIPLVDTAVSPEEVTQLVNDIPSRWPSPTHDPSVTIS